MATKMEPRVAAGRKAVELHVWETKSFAGMGFMAKGKGDQAKMVKEESAVRNCPHAVLVVKRIRLKQRRRKRCPQNLLLVKKSPITASADRA